MAVVRTRSKGAYPAWGALRGAPAVWAAIVLLLVGTTCYEATVALGWLSLGTEGGEGPPGERFILGIAVVVLILGAALSFVAISRVNVRDGFLAHLMAPAGAAFMTARFYTFDPYYLPTLRRMSDGGVIPPAWIFVLIALCLVAALVIRFRPASGFKLTGGMLLACAFTALFEGTGH